MKKFVLLSFLVVNLSLYAADSRVHRIYSFNGASGPTPHPQELETLENTLSCDNPEAVIAFGVHTYTTAGGMFTNAIVRCKMIPELAATGVVQAYYEPADRLCDMVRPYVRDVIKVVQADDTYDNYLVVNASGVFNQHGNVIDGTSKIVYKGLSKSVVQKWRDGDNTEAVTLDEFDNKEITPAAQAFFMRVGTHICTHPAVIAAVASRTAGVASADRAPTGAGARDLR